MKKVELLLPVGNTETFYAALEGGADAVYLGMKQFNARERAVNFSNAQIPVLKELAHKEDCKIYITLNTVIKNKELFQLLDVLDFLNNVQPDAVIIQDWGVYLLAKKHFPYLVIHASTQMANHNSLGARYSEIKGFERVILARELTMKEIHDINIRSNIETEVFVHGALCYSFSGMCNFSSFLGGHGANRGICSQVCRRHFDTGNKKQYYFSLKDNQQIENVADLIKAGVVSLKVEGRLKSDDYVYKVAQAYRSIIDTGEISQANEMLKTETGRAKTSYFPGNDLSDAITYKSPNTGIYLGEIDKSNDTEFQLKTNIKIDKPFRIRIKLPDKEEQKNLKIKEYTIEDDVLKIKVERKYPVRSKVYLSGITEKKFPSKLPELNKKIRFGYSTDKKKKIINDLSLKSDKQSNLFVRIDSLQWMKKIRFDEIDKIIFSFTRNEFEQLKPESGLVQKFKHKILIEFPHFISEDNIEFYSSLAKKYSKVGLRHFILSHLSQKLLLPKEAKFSTNENVYAYNDAAFNFIRSEGGSYITYPVENDKENIDVYMNRSGILPVYFYPRLFISRMPVKIKENESFKGDMGNTYYKFVNDGVSYTIPEHPVSFLQYVNQFKKLGFKNFLIDLSFEKPSGNRLNTLMKRFKSSQQIQPSYNFNYKRVLK